MIRLNPYLERIELKAPFAADRDSLYRLHFQHATHIPFENLDIQLGLPLSLDLESLQSKMVERKRGGYCFEQNTLFQAALKGFGFAAMACEARVRLGRAGLGPRTHMLLIVEVEGNRYLCDVGFGAELLHPVPMDGEIHKQFLWTYRVVEEGALRILQIANSDGWLDLYAFRLEECAPIDFELANWYTSTHPQSRFVQTLTVQRPTPEARYILRNRTLIIDRGGAEELREVEGPAELLDVLQTTFGLSFPQDTRFRNPSF